MAMLLRRPLQLEFRARSSKEKRVEEERKGKKMGAIGKKIAATCII